MKIGIMGGTFNPVHNGHLLLAETAKHAAMLDEIWFMPSGLPAHKSNNELISGSHRFTMVELAVSEKKGFVASSFELDRPGFTYTADTMEGLVKEYPQHEFYFLIGGDSLMKFHQWVKPDVISKHTTLLATGRTGFSEEELRYQSERLFQLFGTRVILMSMPDINISSNQIRTCIREKCVEDILEFLPKPVWHYIEEHQLYQ